MSQKECGGICEGLQSALTTDPTREPFERETRLLWSAKGERLSVCTAERSLMSRFLQHPQFELESFAARTDDGERSFRVISKQGAEPNADDWDGEPVVSIRGTIPIGCLLVREQPRGDHAGHADVVTSEVLA